MLFCNTGKQLLNASVVANITSMVALLYEGNALDQVTNEDMAHRCQGVLLRRGHLE